MKSDLGHWGRLAPAQRPPKTIRDKLDILGLAMGRGNGLGVMGMYLAGGSGDEDLARVLHLITRGTGRMALDWGLGELEKKKGEGDKKV